MYIKPLLLIIICLSLYSCQNTTQMVHDLNIQGHRGCRGLMPENTIPGFIRAVEMGVTSIEMDVTISADHQVVISHEAYFHHNFLHGTKS